MPQAKSGGSGSRRTSGASGAKRSASSARTSSRGPSSSRAKASSAGSSAKSSAIPNDPRLDATAQRLRKLNERIIEAGKGAGEVTLTSYEKALKMIASTIERGPGTSDVEWVSNLATAQAKFIRDVTEAWTSAARGMLK
jgi:hypothetical protein